MILSITAPLLSSDNSSEGFARSYAYDGFGRSNGVTHTVDLTGEQFSWQTSTNYDQFGRVFQQFDASGNSRGTQNSYSYVHLTALKEAQRSSTVYYQATGMNVFGQFSSWTLGNGHTGTARYDAKSGYLQTLNVDLSGVSVQDHVYEYDGLGNLHARIDNNGGASVGGLSEVFTYDSLNRLKTVKFNTVSTLDLNYFDNGNMSSKSDVASGGAYAYGVKNSQCSVTPGTHALSGIGSTHKYCYDNRGNQIGAYVNGLQSRSVDFTVYDKPSRIWSDEAVTEFSYDATFNRFRRTDDTGSSSSKSYYIGGNEIVMHDSGLVEYKRYIGDFALNVIRSNATQDTHYLHRDHIGSIAAIANDSGTLTDKLSYDAFGKRREGSSWTALQSVFTTPSIQVALAKTHQGFTGHEHVDHANIIHMGGRIYDPAVGRFVQADPLIQAPENGQSLNRYSYVFNNPLSLTDPSGYKTVCKQADQRGGNEVCTEITERQYEGLLAMANEIRGKGLMNAPIDDIVSGLAAALEGVSTWSFDADGGGGDIEQSVASDEPTEEQATPSPYAGLSVQQANNQIASSIKLDTKQLILEVAYTMEHVESLDGEFGGKGFTAELTLTFGGTKYDVNNGASLIYPDIKASIGRAGLSFEVQLAKMSENGFQINSLGEVAASWTLKAGGGISDSDTGSSIGVSAAFDKDKFTTGGKVCGQGSCVSTAGGITHLGQGRFSFIAHQAGMGFKG